MECLYGKFMDLRHELENYLDLKECLDLDYSTTSF